jgi:hypothetical protein
MASDGVWPYGLLGGTHLASHPAIDSCNSTPRPSGILAHSIGGTRVDGGAGSLTTYLALFHWAPGSFGLNLPAASNSC